LKVDLGPTVTTLPAIIFVLCGDSPISIKEDGRDDMRVTRSRCTFCRIEYGIVEIVLRDHLNEGRDKRSYAFASSTSVIPVASARWRSRDIATLLSCSVVGMASAFAARAAWTLATAAPAASP
jgi:hypothetical protein